MPVRSRPGAASTAIALVGVATLAVVSSLATVRASSGLEGVPGYAHIGVLVLENESESSTWGSASPAKYLNSLVPDGAFAQSYYADGHVSLDNYITMTSGQPGNPATDSDCLSENLYACQQTVNTPAFGTGTNIGDQVETAGLTWKEYADSMPSACLHGSDSMTATPPDPYQGNSTAPPAGNYADRHNGFNYYTDIEGNAARCAAHDVPYTQLATDIASNAVPNYFFITPDTCHDGHDSPCATGSPVPATCTESGAPANAAGGPGLLDADCWLQNNLPSLLTYLNAHDGVLLITTDEGASSDLSGCCTGGAGGTGGPVAGQGFGGLVGLLALGPGVKAGYTSTISYDHASQLRTVEDALGISTHINNASTATAMSDLFTQPSSNTPEVPATLLLPVAGALAVIGWTTRRSRRGLRRDVAQ